jgi:hypothetical protein
MNESRESITSVFDLFIAENVNNPTPRLFKSIKEHAKINTETGAWFREQVTSYVPESELSWQDLDRLYEECDKVYNDLPNELKIKFKQMLIQDWVTKV